MKRYAKITPEGNRDQLFEECEARNRTEGTLTKFFRGRGYHEVHTPTLEFFDVFASDSYGMPLESMYKLTDHKGRLMVLRPDCTAPIARMVATRLKDADLPIRMYYRQEVYRVSPSMAGRSNQVAQTGVELIGASGKRADLEVIALAAESIQACGVQDFTLEIGHAGFFQKLAANLNLNEEGREKVRSLIEVKNYAALNDILDQMEDCPSVQVMRALPRLFGGGEVFSRLESLGRDMMDGPIAYLKELYESLRDLGLEGRVLIDLGLVHQNDYYTGVIFRGYMRGYGDVILSGGRYDNLMQEFGDPLPATGFGINVDSLVRAKLERQEYCPPKAADVLVHSLPGYEIQGLRHLDDLVNQGLHGENSVFQEEQEALEYAKRQGIARVDVVGESIRTVTTGEEETR
nr:ATP phosphoribosyltransferase regulatory subunit [uncultured Solibaculum sp.]